jgi:hypothetical protein
MVPNCEKGRLPPSPRCFSQVLTDSPSVAAPRKIAAPPVFAKRGADFLLPAQFDHQAKRLLYRLLPGCLP